MAPSVRSPVRVVGNDQSMGSAAHGDTSPNATSASSSSGHTPLANGAKYPWSQQSLAFRSADPSANTPELGLAVAHPLPRYKLSLEAIPNSSDKLILFGGIRDAKSLNDIYIISTEDMKVMPLITTGAIPGSRFEHASVFISAGMFAVWGGGTDLTGRGGLDASLYLFNLVRREWVQVEAPPESPTPSGRYGHSLSAVGSYLVVFGGRVDGRFLDDLWLFDLNTLGSIPAWERCETSVRPASRAYHTCITDGDRIILFGGTDGLYHYSDSWSFDIRTRQWTELECIGFIPSPREGHAAALVGDVMYTFGGRGPGGVDLGDLAALNLPAQRWFMFQNMGPVPSRRFGHGMAAKKGRVFLMGGSSLDDEKGVTMGLVHILDTRSIKYPINKAHPLNPAPSKGPREDADLEQRDKSDTHVSDLDAMLQRSLDRLSGRPTSAIDNQQDSTQQQNDHSGLRGGGEDWDVIVQSEEDAMIKEREKLQEDMMRSYDTVKRLDASMKQLRKTLQDRSITLNQQEQALREKEAELQGRERGIISRTEELDAREADAERAKEDIAAMEQKLWHEENELQSRLDASEQREEDLRHKETDFLRREHEMVQMEEANAQRELRLNNRLQDVLRRELDVVERERAVSRRPPRAPSPPTEAVSDPADDHEMRLSRRDTATSEISAQYTIRSVLSTNERMNHTYSPRRDRLNIPGRPNSPP